MQIIFSFNYEGCNISYINDFGIKSKSAEIL